ncbi:MAG: thiamine pyrophosphate-binding protein [Deltaproteobacteria bacterium]|nr:thiamine pyrophosphate-binding protein [Deltaproteobacteria bacterium]
MNEEVIMTGGEALLEMLIRHGGRVMFGLGGFQLLPFYDAIQRQKEPLLFRHVAVNDEGTGAFAADAYARVAGCPGICDGTLGPGALNLTTGIVESYTAGIPLIAIVGDSNRDHSGKNMTQEICQREVLSPVVKEYLSVERGHRIPEFVRRAFGTVTSGRPGPVVLSIPENVAHNQCAFRKSDLEARRQAVKPPAYRIRAEEQAVKTAAELIRGASRPILLVGGGIHLSGAYDELRSFAENFSMPVAYTLSGKGALPSNHPLCINLFGRFDRFANDLIKSADLLIALGCKFGEIATVRYTLIPESAKIIHIDITPEEIGKHQPVDCGLWSDCRTALVDIADELKSSIKEQQEKRNDYISEIGSKKREWKEKHLSRLTSVEQPITIARVCHELSRVMPHNGILVADGGFAAHWSGLLYEAPSAGRVFVANRGNASIGYGLPGGIGAQLAAEKNPVVALTGDGGFNVALGDLETAIRELIPLTVIILNNASFGYVKGLQHAIFQGRYQSSDLREMNYAAIAKAMGCQGIRVEDPAQLSGAIAEGISERSLPTVIDVIVTRDPARMLPAVDARTQSQGSKGDRPI